MAIPDYDNSSIAAMFTRNNTNKKSTEEPVEEPVVSSPEAQGALFEVPMPEPIVEQLKEQGAPVSLGERIRMAFEAAGGSLTRKQLVGYTGKPYTAIANWVSQNRSKLTAAGYDGREQKFTLKKHATSKSPKKTSKSRTTKPVQLTAAVMSATYEEFLTAVREVMALEEKLTAAAAHRDALFAKLQKNTSKD